MTTIPLKQAATTKRLREEEIENVFSKHGQEGIA
jgi:hypothetical protein